MRRWVRWSGLVLGGVAGVAAVAALVLYLWSESMLRRVYDYEPRTIIASADAESLALGKKIAHTRGCLGCHRPEGQGGLFVDIPGVARIPAPNLTRLVQSWDIEALERSIRQGIRVDGRSVFGMPSGMYQYLADEEFGALIAFLRGLPVSDLSHGERALWPLARLFIVRGRFEPERLNYDAYPPVRPAPGDPLAHGAYLAQTACSECHGPTLHGWGDVDAAPGLAIVAAYTADEFLQLMKTGQSASGRDLQLMAAVARGRFAHFSPDEINAIYAYLTSEAFYALARED